MQAIIFCSIRETKQRKGVKAKKKWLEQMGNGKDGTFCGKEKMQMSVYYSIGSIFIGVGGMVDSIRGER